jgi:regulator of CtrA degradation
MSQPATINPRIIEALYCEALVLADEVRVSFDKSVRQANDRDEEDLARIALSCEALRTTTRMMHGLAWLLNHRAYFSGELTEFQLLRHGRLAVDYPAANAERLALVDPHTRSLIGATERFYARLVRIDRGWRERGADAPAAIARLRDQLGIPASN